MRYLIYSSNSINEAIGLILSKELSRFDIRAETILVDSLRKSMQAVQEQNFDLLIRIGGAFPKRLSGIARIKKLKTCFLHQRLANSNGLMPSAPERINLNYSDLPDKDRTFRFFGNPILDLVKSLKPDVGEDGFGLEPTIAVAHLSNQQVLAEKLIAGLRAMVLGSRFTLVNLEVDLEKSIPLLSTANTALAFDDFSELASLALNCPVLRINKQHFFRKNQYSVSNYLLKRDVIEVLGNKQLVPIKEELLRVLNDHSRCAEILHGFQEVKEILGNHSAIRRIAQDIIEQLEEN